MNKYGRYLLSTLHLLYPDDCVKICVSRIECWTAIIDRHCLSPSASTPQASDAILIPPSIAQSVTTNCSVSTLIHRLISAHRTLQVKHVSESSILAEIKFVAAEIITPRSHSRFDLHEHVLKFFIHKQFLQNMLQQLFFRLSFVSSPENLYLNDTKRHFTQYLCRIDKAS